VSRKGREKPCHALDNARFASIAKTGNRRT
jgi:hypothetical protein